MQQAYRDLYREVGRNRGLLGVLSLWGQILSDFVSTVLWEYLDDYERVHWLILSSRITGMCLFWIIFPRFFLGLSHWHSESGGALVRRVKVNRGGLKTTTVIDPTS
jgi:hypothetical protein